MCDDKYECLKIGNQLCFPLYACSKEIVRRYKPFLDELDLTSAESKATYAQIKEYILEKFDLKVSTLYIAQIKKKCGIVLREHYNKSKKEKHVIPQCTPEKEEAIMDALRHFKMI